MRCIASAWPVRSMLLSLLNSATTQSMIELSQSSPPRCVSPLVAFTSNTLSPISKIEISNVPPPKSYTAIFSSFFLSSPYASEAAVGSLMIRNTSRPAILPASLVACRCVSLKYAGTVMTACVMFSPKRISASAFSLASTIEASSCGLYVFFSPSTATSIAASPLLPETTLYGIRLDSSFTSLNLRPMKRLAE